MPTLDLERNSTLTLHCCSESDSIAMNFELLTSDWKGGHEQPPWPCLKKDAPDQDIHMLILFTLWILHYDMTMR